MTGLTAGGIGVTVALPYAYRVEQDGEPILADATPEAAYEVTPFGIRRVGGDETDSC